MFFFKLPYAIFLIYSMYLSVVKTDVFNSSTSKVVKLDGKTFNQKILSSNTPGIWIVFFYDVWSEIYRNFSSSYEVAAAALHGFIKLGALNIDEHPEFKQRFDLKKSDLKIFGLDYHHLDYAGPKTTKALLDFAVEAIKKKIDTQLASHEDYLQKKGKLPNVKFSTTSVAEITDSNYLDVVKENSIWFFLFYSRECEMSKALAIMWANAADELKNRANFGAIDAVRNELLRNKFLVTDYPSIRHLSRGSSKVLDPVHQINARSAKDVIQYVLDRLAHNKVENLMQLTGYNTFEQECGNQQLCIIAFLPHIVDCNKACRLQYLETFKIVIEKYKMMFWGWTWSEAGAQPDLENSLDVAGVGYPIVTIIHITQMRYSKIIGSFTFETMDKALKRIKSLPAYEMETGIDIYPIKSWSQHEDAEDYDGGDDEDGEGLDEPIKKLWLTGDELAQRKNIKMKGEIEELKFKKEEL